MKLNRKELIELLTIARFAPTVHNTQPWLVEATDDGLVIRIDSHYQLKAGDPTTRETIISLGIFTEAIIIALKATGVRTGEVWIDDASAFIDIRDRVKPDISELKQIKYLKTRHTDRSIYKPVLLDAALVSALQKLSSTACTVRLLDRSQDINKIAELTGKGIGLALSNPAFRHELSNYLYTPWSRKKRGIAVTSLHIPRLVAYLEPFSMKLGWGLWAEVALEKKRWLSASGVVLITARGDMPEYWFDTGRVYLRVSLLLESKGISQATSAAMVEASTYHEDVEAILHTEERLLCVLRIGSGSRHKRYSPRVNPEELLLH